MQLPHFDTIRLGAIHSGRVALPKRDRRQQAGYDSLPLPEPSLFSGSLTPLELLMDGDLMKRSIATTLLLGTFLVGGVTACSQSNSSEPSQAGTMPSDAPQGDKAPSPERAQRREAMRKQIEAVLTPEQSQQLQTKLQQGVRMREAMASLNLTPEQKTKIQDIMKAARAQRQGQAPASSSQ